MSRPLAWLCAGLLAAGAAQASSAPAPKKSAGPTPSATAVDSFKSEIQPLLQKYCYECHGDGMSKGGVAFDSYESEKALVGASHVWLGSLVNVRAGVMPPQDATDRPTEEEVSKLVKWIKYQAFNIDPANPDPGRVTVRRLNRVEYRNTIRDLMGIDFNAEAEFPPDDTGNGFDNNGDVLTISPLHLEKYLAAAETIVEQAVPKVAKVMTERVAFARDFRVEGGGRGGENLNARNHAKLSKSFRVDQAETYEVSVELEVRGSFDFDPSHCKVICRIDGEERFVEDVVWSERRVVKHDYKVQWKPGEHTVAFEVVPVLAAGEAVAAVATPETKAPAAAGGSGGAGAGGANPERERPRAQQMLPATNVTVRIASVKVAGPLPEKFWSTPATHARFFPQGAAPADEAGRERYAGEVLRRFATRAFRRPVEEARVAHLVTIAKTVYNQPGKTFEQGVARAMMAVLASPHFIFRVEQPEAGFAKGAVAPLDEYALASRLSYFLWSTMPDEELFQAAEKGELRKNLHAQFDRMLKDGKSQAFVKNFTGQWLQARDVESVPINARMIFGPGAAQGLRSREGRLEFDGDFRRAMRSETEMSFDYVMKEDRSVLELLDADYAFVNERLATLYNIPDVKGADMRRVKLPENSPRGGILTQGTILTVTSNPTRTSPVKRGLFILENILGTPPPPAPPNVPDLEDARKEFKGREPRLSEMLALHRQSPLCSSCHERMDPLGLAMENFNAMGGWRDTEAKQPIDPAGKLVTGETFADIRALKKVLVTEPHRRMDFYRCLTEKLMVYALGRGIEPQDAHTIDEIAQALEREGGKMSALMRGVIESPAFQKQRVAPAVAVTSTAGSQE